MINLQAPPTSTSVDDGKILRNSWSLWFTMLGQKVNEMIGVMTGQTATIAALQNQLQDVRALLVKHGIT